MFSTQRKLIHFLLLLAPPKNIHLARNILLKYNEFLQTEYHYNPSPPIFLPLLASTVYASRIIMLLTANAIHYFVYS
jgi:hypothetical protein